MTTQSILRTSVLFVLCVLFVLSFSGIALADEPAPPGKVKLPLKDYLSLLETAERVERQRAEDLARRETPVAEVVSQHVAVAVGRSEAEIAADFEVLLQGKVMQPVFLPLAGFPEKIDIRDESGRAGTAAVTASEGGVMLAAPQPGHYTVHVDSRASLGSSGTGPLPLGRVAAPVASTEIDLPAELAWSSPGAVVVEEREENGRRRVRLATARGTDTVLDVRRKVDSAEADKLLAQSVVLTILQLRPEGLRRHDVILYEVRRGSLGSFSVELPPGLEIEQAGTDEGTVVPVVETGRLTVHRQHQLQGVGYLVLSSTLPMTSILPADGISLEALKPEAEVRAHYLAISSAVAADVRPLPEKSWTRVDLSDLPAVLSEALAALDLTAAWRLAADGTGARLAVAPLPAAPARDVTIRRRDTTTLMTVDGTLLFSDHFVVDSRGRPGAALDIVLPVGGKLWSAKVDDQPVRPLERGGVVSVPLGFSGGTRAEVEVVSVVEKALPPGRSQLSLELPQVKVPVLLHRLRLLLPEDASYRVRRGDLRFAVIRPGRVNVGGNESGQQSAYVGPGSLAGGYANLYATVTDEQGEPLPGATLTLRKNDGMSVQVSDARGQARFLGMADGSYSLKVELDGFSSIEYPSVVLTNGRNTQIEVALQAAVEDVMTVQAETPLLDERRISTGDTVSQTELEKIPTARDSAALFRQEAQGLEQGLVGGVKPLPVAIPETGKAFAFSGVLPPERITLELDVKGKGKR
ncbi:MAG TPA: carboxypeptidase-like regulatory domain-containing protein [Thermoanaerobaculia bacterium]|nr:carboxypeptidase-like regulatory domain-containing protein [Thermoanaerobaculia bacterium]